MIAPRNRLLIWFGLIAAPCGLGFAWYPYLSAAILVGFSLVAMVDAMKSPRQLRSVEIRLPDVCRLTRNRPGSAPVELRNQGNQEVDLVVSPAFPPGIRTSEPLKRIKLLPASRASIAWPCVGLRRGRYHIESCRAESRSQLGLWSIRSLLACHCEARVYPDLRGEREKVASLFLRGGSGMHRMRQVGQGREFEKLRDYLPGDSYSDIHWRATAKRRRPVTKLFQVERTQEVYVLIDASRLASRLVEDRSSSREKKPEGDGHEALEYFVSATLILALAAQEQGDRFGLLVYSDRVRRFIRSGAGKPHFDACRQAVYDLEPEPVSPDLKELASFIGSSLRRRALLVFLTDFDDPLTTEEFLRNMDVVARRHLVLVNILKPAGLGRLFETEAHSADDIYRALAGQLERQKIRELERTMYRMGIRMEQLEAEWLSARLISQYLSVKQRQAL